jgi:hypothetical protein
MKALRVSRMPSLDVFIARAAIVLTGVSLQRDIKRR